MPLTDDVYIREANEDDIEAIALLMDDLGYPTPVNEMRSKLKNIFSHPDYRTAMVKI